MNTDFRYAALPVRAGGRVVGLVRVARPSHAVAESQRLIGSALLWAAAAAAAAAIVLGLLISWIWYAPLRQITHAARKIAAGNLTHRAHMFGSDELSQLAVALNEMRESLRRQIDTIAAQRANLQTVVANLHEGLVATDAEGRVVLMNRRALELLADADAPTTGRHLQEVVRIGEVIDLFNEARHGGRAAGRQIELDRAGRRLTLDVHVAPLDAPQLEGIRGLLVARDVTEAARAAAMKADFVANASHELRTPLATVRAAADALAAVDPTDADTYNRCLQILDRHVRRLEEMTKDLLDLHVIESPRMPLQIERVSFESVAAWIRRTFADLAEERQLELDVRGDELQAAFHSDRRLVEMILKNLVDNAIQFTPAGGRVLCTLNADDKTVCLRIADTGCGIAPEEQSRVFERFYQADAARSGDSRNRGTGLGLAIVKHAAQHLGAQIQLESELNQGTTVTVTISREPMMNP
jgi:PAS domain S-box-containing protein